MRMIALISALLIPMQALAGLPPTTTKGSGDSTDTATFKFREPYWPITHSGTTATIGPTPGTSGNVLTSDGTLWASATLPTVNYAAVLQNVGISAAISSNTLVVSLKQADGSTDPASGSGTVTVGFRGTTGTNGNLTLGTFTAAATITLAATDSIGTVASVAFPLYVYLVSDTTSEVCLSRSWFDDGTLQSASALTGGADTTATTLWCTSAHTTKPIRLIGQVNALWSNPNWGTLSALVVSPKDNGCRHRNALVDECVERATIVCGSPSSITSQSGTFISSVGTIASNRCSVTIGTGKFSAAPSCIASVNTTNNATLFSAHPSVTSVTAMTIGCMTQAASATGACGGPDTFMLECSGPR